MRSRASGVRACVIRFDRLLAGTCWQLIVAAPALADADTRAIDRAAPPPSLNGDVHRQRDAAARRRRAPAAREAGRRRAAPPAPARRTAARAAAPQTAGRRFDIKSTLDKIARRQRRQIADSCARMVTAKQTRPRVERMPRTPGDRSFYAARNYAPLWIHDGRLTARAKAVIARLKDAAADGLDPADYPVPEFGTFTGAEALAGGDIKLTNSVLTFARHLAVGRIAPTRVLAEVDTATTRRSRPISCARSTDARRRRRRARTASTRRMRASARSRRKLAELRSSAPRAEAADDRIPDGRAIKPGAKDARVPELRERLRVHGKSRRSHLRPRALQRRARAAAAARPQADRHHRPARRSPPSTARSRCADQIDRVTANMERWRWLPRDLGKTYVMVNIPDYTLKVVHDHDVVWRTKIVAGKPQTPTPLLTASMDSVIVNPSWYVPQSIIQNELLPRYASDPNIFDRMGLEVKRGRDGNINVVQPPGAANALGRIKFNFPNKFQVYLHDTPEKRLFTYDRRAFSHGCMRVEDPTKFGEIVLHLAMNGHDAEFAPAQRHVRQRRAAPSSSPTGRWCTSPIRPPSSTMPAGCVLRDDIYGFDARIRAIMHRRAPHRRRRAAAGPQARSGHRQEPTRKSCAGSSGARPTIRSSFFERLFR